MKITLQTLPLKVKISMGVAVFALTFGFTMLMITGYGYDIMRLGTANWAVLFIGSVVITIISHEAMHGLFFKLYGGNVRFGAKLWTAFGPVFWASSDKSFPRRQFQVISLAPQILTLILVLLILAGKLSPIMELSLWIMAMTNLSGGAFDIYLVIILNKYPVTVMCRDIKDGLEVCYQ